MNIIIDNEFVMSTDKETLFANEDVTYYNGTDMLPNLLVNLGLFPSTSSARRAGRDGIIPKGWTEMKGNKKTKIWIWNPWC